MDGLLTAHQNHGGVLKRAHPFDLLMGDLSNNMAR